MNMCKLTCIFYNDIQHAHTHTKLIYLNKMFLGSTAYGKKGLHLLWIWAIDAPFFYNDIQHTHGLDKKRLTEFELTLEFVDKWLCLCHLDNNKLLFITIPSCWADTFFLISIVQKQWMKLMNIIGFCQYIVDLLKFIYYDHDEIDVHFL